MNCLFNLWVGVTFSVRRRRRPVGNSMLLSGEKRRFWASFLLAFSLCLPALSQAQGLSLQEPDQTIQPAHVETDADPHYEGNWNVGFNYGSGLGISALGSKTAHDLAIGSLHLGKLLDTEFSVLRHVELSGEMWAGSQTHPNSAYLFGLTPVLRYHVVHHSRWSPFLDLGAGVTATDIGPPDLSTPFQFNLQAGAGVHWRWTNSAGLTLQARYIHVSNGGIRSPNSGANSFVFSGGVTWFF